ncbi:glycosyltransferase [Botrimarina sp.]|uniref:glycosyltransferase family 2 protein n=1 Tax=Botrimarina sp. TaxID=2795802 RepID=UPI0032ED7015
MSKRSAATPPRVSVLLPVRNGEKYLKAAIRSVVRQTFRDFELILLNDGSTDNTSRIIAREAKRDPRIVCKQYEGMGLPAVLNQGLAEASGEYVARMDADDVCYPQRFAEQVKALEDHPDLVLVGCQLTRIDSAGFEIDKLILPTDTRQIVDNLLAGHGGQVMHPAFMFRTAAARRIGGYDEAYNTAQDFDFLLRIRQEGRIENLDQFLLKYRLHESSITKARAAEQRAAKLAALGRHLGSEALPTGGSVGEQPHAAVGASHDDVQLEIARAARRAGNWATAVRNAAAVLRRSPSNREARWLLVDSSPRWLQLCLRSAKNLLDRPARVSANRSRASANDDRT